MRRTRIFLSILCQYDYSISIQDFGFISQVKPFQIKFNLKTYSSFQSRDIFSLQQDRLYPVLLYPDEG